MTAGKHFTLTIVLLIGVYLVMAGFSCTIHLKTFYLYIKKPKAIGIGLFTQYGALPLSAYLITKLLNLEALYSMSFIILSSCPGGTLSNFWCWFFGSDLPLSIAMTTASSILSFAFLTINCLIYMPLIVSNNQYNQSAAVNIDYSSLGLSVSSLICGVITGLFISYKLQHTQNNNNNNIYFRIKQILIILGGLSIILTLLVGAYQNMLLGAVPAYQLSYKIFLGLIILNITSWFISLTISYFLFKLSHNQSITVGIECSNQNMGLAIAILLLTLDEDSADIAIGAPMAYGVLNAVGIFIFGTFGRLFGCIKNDDDDSNNKPYLNSGFTKLYSLCFDFSDHDSEINNNEHQMHININGSSITSIEPLNKQNDNDNDDILSDITTPTTINNDITTVTTPTDNDDYNDDNDDMDMSSPSNKELIKLNIKALKIIRTEDDAAGDHLNITSDYVD